MSMPAGAMRRVGLVLGAVVALAGHTVAWSNADEGEASHRHRLDSQQVDQRVQAARTRLKLTPEQEAQIKPLLREEAEKLRAIQSKHAADSSRTSRMAQLHEARAVQADLHAQLSKVLSAEQMAEWDRMRKEAVSKARARRHLAQGDSSP